MLWLPAPSDEVLSTATPPLTVALPSTVAPSLNCTVPVAALGVTAAVKVTDCPEVAGFSDEVTVTLELVLDTVTTTAVELLAVSLPSPLYRSEEHTSELQ